MVAYRLLLLPCENGSSVFLEVNMRSLSRWICVPLAIFAVACARDNGKVDDALNADLQLANQSRQFQPIDSVSALEQGYIKAPAQAYAQRSSQATAPRVIYRSAPRSSSGGGYSNSEPVYRVEKHTKRDAAIGAAAGAAIGAVTSRDKLKGAVIGAVAGGILGGVLGNNVDKSKKRQ
jgi:hypothetical protein